MEGEVTSLFQLESPAHVIHALFRSWERGDVYVKFSMKQELVCNGYHNIRLSILGVGEKQDVLFARPLCCGVDVERISPQ